MRLVIVTGMSGAGKSTVLDVLEDAGYFCVDNLPIMLLEKFVQLSLEAGEGGPGSFAAGIDIRDGNAFDRLGDTLRAIRELGVEYEILFLDADDETLIKRYKETRRSHPLSRRGRIEEGIRLEREKMDFLRTHATYTFNTGGMLVRELSREVSRIFVKEEEYRKLFVTILSFGFKYGIPADSDLVFDVRFLPNPYYAEELREKTGLDKEVAEFLAGYPQTKEFENRLAEMVRFLIPHYISEGKRQLVISLGCTGGQHRSVAMAAVLYRELIGEEGCSLKLEHRDIEKRSHRSAP